MRLRSMAMWALTVAWLSLPAGAWAHPCTPEDLDELQLALSYLKYNPHNSELLIKIAEEYERRNQPDEAVQYYDRYLSEQPNDLTLTLKVAQISYDLGFLPLSERHYKKALMMSPNKSSDLHFRLGLVYSDMNQPESAVSQYQSALRDDPQNPDALGNLGFAYLEAGRLSEALSHLTKAVQLSPSNPDRHNMLGLAYLEAGRVKEAEKSFRKALDLSPGKINYHYNLGESLRKQGLEQQALSEYNQALQGTAENTDERFNQGKIYLKIGLYQEAVKSFTQALAEYKDVISQGQTVLALGYAYESLGNTLMARQNFERYLKLMADGPAAADVRERLQKLN